jgi:citrate lyase gamma subunit
MLCIKCNNYYDITDNIEEQVGGENIEEYITNVINKREVNDINMDVNDVENHPAFKKLKAKQKEMVLKKVNMNDMIGGDTKVAYLICYNCGYNEEIKDDTLIFSKTTPNISKMYTTDNHNMKYSKIIPRTVKYVCPNDKCETHKKPEKKKAVFFRQNNSYNIKYVCLVCDTKF